MIKATELMLGDWVYCHHPSLPKEAIRVERGLINNLDWQNQGHIKECDALYREVEPIPLTPEILEKNGFKNTDVVIIGTRKMRWVSDDTRTEITIWMDDTLPMEIVKNVYYEDEVAYTLPFPGTVSQLQHALKLCGIAKTIEV